MSEYIHITRREKMTVCRICHKVLPGKYDPSEVVICKKCAKMFSESSKTCGTCNHFMGGGDWNLCCDQMYDLCYENTKACEKYELNNKMSEAIAEYVAKNQTVL